MDKTRMYICTSEPRKLNEIMLNGSGVPVLRNCNNSEFTCEM